MLFSQKYKLGSVVYGPGCFKYYGITVTQHEDSTIMLNADNKLECLSPYPLDNIRRKQIESEVNPIELTAFRSVNTSLSWVGTAMSPFCSFASSYMQQKLPNVTVQDLVTQANLLAQLKKLGTSICFKRPTDKKSYTPSIVVFADASRRDDVGQLGYIIGLLIGDMAEGTICHTISWSSTKSKRPVKSIGSAEVFAIGSGIDEGKVIVQAYESVLNMKLDLVIVVDSKDLYDTISTCRLATDRSIRGDISLMRYDFETHKITRMVWIKGTTNLSDPLTKRDSPLMNSLQLLLYTGKLPLSFDVKLSRDSNRSTG